MLAVSGNGDVTVLDDYDKGLDEERVSRWFGGNDAVGWKVQEGLDKRWESLEGMSEMNHLSLRSVVGRSTGGRTLINQIV